MVKSKRMMETDKKTGIKQQFMPVTHVSAVLGLREFIQGNFFQADFDRVMGMLQEHYDKASAEIDQKAENIEKYANEKIAEFDGKLSDSNKRMTALEKEIQETQQIIEENDIPTRQEISANVIYQLIGKDEVELTFSIDFLNKESGNVEKNASRIRYNIIKDLVVPEKFGGTELNDNLYELLSKLDSRNCTIIQNVKDYSSAVLVEFDLLDYLRKNLSENFFTDQGVTTNKECAEIIRNIVTYRKASAYASGSSAQGQKISMRMFSNITNTWLGSASSSSSTTSLIAMDGLENTNIHYINDDGIVYMLLFAETADGTTASTVSVDYLNHNFKIKISVNQFIKSMIAAYHREMGLSNLVFKKVGEV